MAVQAVFVNTNEPITHDDLESIANLATYNVVSGCTLSYSGATLVVTVASGTVTHNGTSTAVAGNTVTLVPDGSNPLWAYIYVASSGTAAIVHGTAAATPAKPSLGDNVMIGAVKVDAGLTIASSASQRLFKAIPAIATSPVTLAGTLSAATSTTSTSAVDLGTIAVSSIAVGKFIRITGNYRKSATTANRVVLGLKLNSTVVAEAVSGAGIAASTATQQAEDGYFEILITPRSSASYLAGITFLNMTRVSATGANGISPAYITSTLTALIPNAAITSVVIRGINDTNSNALEIFDVKVLTW